MREAEPEEEAIGRQWSCWEASGGKIGAKCGSGGGGQSWGC